MNTKKKTQKPKPQQRLSKGLKNKLKKSLVEDIHQFGGCKEVATYSLVKFLNERAAVYGASDSQRRKVVENYFYYFNRLTRKRLLAIKEALDLQPVYYSSEEDCESDNNEDDEADLVSPQRSTSFTPPRRAAAPEWSPRLTPVPFPTMSSSQGKHVRANH